MGVAYCMLPETTMISCWLLVGGSETEKLNGGIKQTYNIVFYSVKSVFFI